MENTKVVYIHRKATNGEVFYVGAGTEERANKKSPSVRSVCWTKTFKKHGVTVEIVRKGLSAEEAFGIEEELIELIGRKDKGLGTLVNRNDGLAGGGGRGLLAYNTYTGKLYNSVKDACKEESFSWRSVNNQLKGESRLADWNHIRTVEEPYLDCEFELPDGTVYLDDIDGVENMSEYSFSYLNRKALTEEEEYTVKTIRGLSDEEYELVELSSYNTLREMGEIKNIPFGTLYGRINKIKKKVLNKHPLS